MVMKKISVVIPAYNIESYLGRCLDSLLAQSYPELEIIVTDDGSSDGTGALLDRYAAEYPKIIAIHQKNGGVTAARLAALKRAKGDYIGFVDGDDLVDREMFQTLIADAEEYDADIAHCGYQWYFLMAGSIIIMVPGELWSRMGKLQWKIFSVEILWSRGCATNYTAGNL